MTDQHFISRGLTAWIATIAILFGVFSPLVGHSLANASGQDGQYLAVCTSTGVQYVKLDLDNSGDRSDGLHQVQSECAWCFSAMHGPGMVGAEPQHDFTAQGKAVCTSFAIIAPGTRFAWSPSLARAPPALT